MRATSARRSEPAPEATPAPAPEAPARPPHRVLSRGPLAGQFQAFPDVLRTRAGELLCAFYAGYAHVALPDPERGWPRGGRLCLVRSPDGGATWSPPAILHDGPEDDRDPHLAELPDGTLL